MMRTLAIGVVGVLVAALVAGGSAAEAAEKGKGGARSNLASGDIAVLENAFGNAGTKGKVKAKGSAKQRERPFRTFNLKDTFPQ
jgi:hypothetical protein